MDLPSVIVPRLLRPQSIGLLLSLVRDVEPLSQADIDVMNDAALRVANRRGMDMTAKAATALGLLFIAASILVAVEGEIEAGVN